MTKFLTTPAELNKIALNGQEVAQKEFSLDVMIPRWEATRARVRTPHAYAQGESR